MVAPLGYINSIQDPSGPLPGPAGAFALAITQGAGKALLNRRNGQVQLNTKAFVWTGIGSAPLDLYLKIMMLRCMRSGNGAYINTAKAAVGADDAAPLGWTSAPLCRAAYYFKWADIGMMVLFDDAFTPASVAIMAYDVPTVDAVGPDGVNWGHVWKPFQDAWTADRAGFLSAFNALRQAGTSYQFVGHGYGGSLAHLFARYVGATYNFSPSLITRINSGVMGRADYAAATKLPQCVDCFNQSDAHVFWPPRYLGQYSLNQLRNDGEWGGPQARYVRLEGTRLVYAGGGGPLIWQADEQSLRFGTAADVRLDPPSPYHGLALAASILYRSMNGTQQAYPFIFDLHSIEGALTAGGF